MHHQIHPLILEKNSFVNIISKPAAVDKDIALKYQKDFFILFEIDIIQENILNNEYNNFRNV
jgi:hypothetical protein